MYQALYRKWRPKTFDEVVGQDHITEILKKQVLTDRPSHAYLFTGTRGTGKTTCAKILAKAVNCLNPVGGNPCNECEICRGIESGSILDVTEMDAASNNGVDDVRAIRDEAVYAPVAARRRVYIVDEVHMLSKPAFNALLKTIEEPPEHLIFILATTELYKVPATILSRCQRYSFRRVPPDLIRGRLLQVARAEGLELTDEAADLLSRLADGALRDALSLLDQCSGAKIDRERVLSAIGLAENEEICRLLEAIQRGDSDTALSILDSLYQAGKDVASVLDQLSALHRDLLLRFVAPGSGSVLMSGGYSDALLDRLCRNTDAAHLLAALDALEESSASLDRASDRRLSAELCLVRLCGLKPAPFVMPAVTVQEQPAPEEQRYSIAEPEEAPVLPEEDKPEETAPPVPEQPAFTWEALLKKLEDVIFMGDYVMLSDPANVTGETEGDTLTLTAKNESARQLIQRSLTEIRTGAEQLAGRPVAVKVQGGGDGGDRFAEVDNLFNTFNFGG
jgi:DNA polymerase-3 subunit gamma/tau